MLNRIRGVMRGERADAELLSSELASDFGCFYDRHVRAVTAFVGSWIGEPDVVFDLVAETFARALEHRRMVSHHGRVRSLIARERALLPCRRGRWWRVVIRQEGTRHRHELVVRCLPERVADDGSRER